MEHGQHKATDDADYVPTTGERGPVLKLQDRDGSPPRFLPSERRDPYERDAGPRTE